GSRYHQGRAMQSGRRHQALAPVPRRDRHDLPELQSEQAEMAVDLKSPEGKAIVHRLAARADVVVESYGTGVAERLGIDYATLSALNARLIYCSISGFGRTGALSHA